MITHINQNVQISYGWPKKEKGRIWIHVDGEQVLELSPDEVRKFRDVLMHNWALLHEQKGALS